MTTLTELRTDFLNVTLGLDSDSDNRFGTTAIRNLALQDGARRLWPEMAFLDTEAVTIVTDQIDYTLTSLREVISLELTSSTATRWFSDAGKDFTAWYDEDSGHVRLRLPQAFDPTLSLTARGYSPYSVPAAGGDSFDVPSDQQWIIVEGAVAFLYRRMMNSFMTYERHENENRKTSLSPEQVLTMYRDAEARYQSAKATHRRRLVVPRRAIRVR